MNRDEQKRALEAIKLMLGARLNSQSSIGPDTVKGYMIAVAGCSLSAVERACTGFMQGNVIGFNNDFAPSGARLAEEARKWDEADKLMANVKGGALLADGRRERLIPYKIGSGPPPPAEPLGPLDVDFGNGRIDMRAMSPAEKEAVLQHKGLPPADDTKQIGLKPKTQGFGR